MLRPRFYIAKNTCRPLAKKIKSLKVMLARAKMNATGNNATRPQRPHGESVSVFIFILMLIFSTWESHPLCTTTLAWKVHVIIFSFHATYFHTLLTPLDFRYVNAQFDFQCVDSSATVGEYMYIYALLQWSLSSLYEIFCLDPFRIDRKMFQAFKERYETFLLTDSGANPFL